MFLKSEKFTVKASTSQRTTLVLLYGFTAEANCMLSRENKLWSTSFSESLASLIIFFSHYANHSYAQAECFIYKKLSSFAAPKTPFACPTKQRSSSDTGLLNRAASIGV